MRGFYSTKIGPNFEPSVLIGNHTRFGIGSAPDGFGAWTHARDNDLAIVTKDADFSQRIVLSAPPPRIVHLRIGNIRRRDFTTWLEAIWPRIESAVATNKLNAYKDRIKAVNKTQRNCRGETRDLLRSAQ
jgi:predicted nuclease of predicted toxin-antitoxin system